MGKIDDEFEYLEYEYKNLQINIQNVKQIINITKKLNDKIVDILKLKVEEYRKCMTSIKKMLERRKKKIEEPGLFNKVATSMSVKLNIKEDEEKNNLIDIIIQGCNFNINSLNKKFDEVNITSKTIIKLKNRIINIEENCIDSLKRLY